jgi:hypothetical protein
MVSRNKTVVVLEIQQQWTTKHPCAIAELLGWQQVSGPDYPDFRSTPDPDFRWTPNDAVPNNQDDFHATVSSLEFLPLSLIEIHTVSNFSEFVSICGRILLYFGRESLDR